MSADFVPLNSLDDRPNNLPAQATPFIGRESDISSVKQELLRPAVRLVTLTGVGGTGKTRLALQVAADLRDDFDDGVFFIELAPVSDAALVIPTIAQRLKVLEAPGKPLLDSLKDRLQDRQLLLLLDNFEQVITAATVVGELLSAAPKLKVLVTSRELLRVYGEQDYPVSPLTLPDPKQLPSLERLMQSEAVQLFSERARAVKSDFRVGPENTLAVAEICYRLDGLPLAIELAAARVRLLPPQKMLAQLGNRLRFLTSGARGVPARQQTLRSTMDWSYELLTDSEKLLFRQLAVFVGGCTLEAAEAVCADDVETPRRDVSADVLNGLQSLLDKSLLKQTEVDGEPRFSMLETIREYAREKLSESGESARVQARHLNACVQFAETAEPKLRGSEQLQWLNRLERDHDNLRAALGWAVAQSESAAALRLSGALGWFWYVRGPFSEGLQLLQQAIALSPRAGDMAGVSSDSRGWHAKALQAAARLVFIQGDNAAARALVEESLALYRAAGDKQGIATSLHNLGVVARFQGDYAAAWVLLEESLALNRELGNKQGIANALVNLGAVARNQGDYAAARMLLEEGLALNREAGHKQGIANALVSLGAVARNQGDYAAARALLEQGLVLCREVGDKRELGNLLNHLGDVAFNQSDFAAARALYEQSLTLYRDLGAKRGIAECLSRFAGVAQEERQPQRAARLLGAVEALLERLDARLETPDRAESERTLAAARAQLDPTTFNAAWAAGRALTMEQAIDDAEKVAAAEPAAHFEPAPPPTYPAGLTEREVGVLRLLARGLSNAEIGEQLVVSPRTVGAHLRSIFAKLDVTTRTAAARVAVELKLV